MNRSLLTGDIRTSPRSIDEAIDQCTSRQLDLMTVPQLRARGLTYGAIHARRRAGRLREVHPGVYTTSRRPLPFDAACLAAVLAGGRGAVLGYLAAASFWDISRFDVAVPSILVPRRHRPIEGVGVQHTRTLHTQDVRMHRSIPMSAPARTMLDLGDVLTKFQLANVMHEAAFRHRLNLRRCDQMVRVGRGRAASIVLRQALELHRNGSVGTRSLAEDAYVGLVHAAMRLDGRVHEPCVNERVRTAAGSIEVDFHWPILMLCVEVDGAASHGRLATREQDLERTSLLRAAGCHVIRVGARDVFTGDVSLVLGRDVPRGSGAGLAHLPSGGPPGGGLTPRASPRTRAGRRCWPRSRGAAA